MDAKTHLKALLDSYDACALECDGMTRVLHTVLSAQQILHQVVVGRIAHAPTCLAIEPHFWIKVPSCNGQDLRVDYRARLWLGDREDVPHGVFAASDSFAVEYSGRVVEMSVLDSTVFEWLTGGMAYPI